MTREFICAFGDCRSTRIEIIITGHSYHAHFCCWLHAALWCAGHTGNPNFSHMIDMENFHCQVGANGNAAKVRA
jgi:hypothetical protein